jgi:hypothetical protein
MLLHLEYYTKRDLFLSIFKSKYPIRLCWILNRFDLSIDLSNSAGTLDHEIVKLFDEGSAYDELYFLFFDQFKGLTNDIQLEIINSFAQGSKIRET